MSNRDQIEIANNEEIVIKHEFMEADGGPQRRQQMFFSERMTSLIPRGGTPQADGLESTESTIDERSDFWLDRIRAFRRRQKHQIDSEPTSSGLESAQSDAAPSYQPSHRWKPIGPFGVNEGLAVTLPVVSGRTTGLAIAPGSTRIYAATANGGVWLSEDRGDSWRSLMDAFDLNPTNDMSDSLACGAIALVAGESAKQDTLFVGSGEGHGGFPSYFGVGPIVSTDGGQNWQTEPVSPENDELAGSGFFALAVDPNYPDRVVAATRRGIYRRESDGYGGFHWVQKSLSGEDEENATSVVAVNEDGTTFYAALHNGLVYSSGDGDRWEVIGNDFPEAARRITLAAQLGNRAVVYAFIENGGRLFRLDIYDGDWREVSNVKDIASLAGGDQGFYDLSIAIAPDNVNLVYLGGSARLAGANGEEIPFDLLQQHQGAIFVAGSLYRCEVTVDSSSGESTVGGELTYIGGSVHADIHALVFEPNEASTLWVGCDGGVFCSDSAIDRPTDNTLIFTDKNSGLQTLTLNHLGQHPTEENILFSGAQDNGIVRFTGEPLWDGSILGDVSYCVLNWHNPDRILAVAPFADITRSEDGGSRDSYQRIFSGLARTGNVDDTLFYSPLASTPISSDEQDANVVAVGSVWLWFSEDFGDRWISLPNDSIDDRLEERIRSIVFSSADKIYAGLFQDEESLANNPNLDNAIVYKFEKIDGEWTKREISALGGAYNLRAKGSVTDIAVDYSDPSGDSIYIALGGQGDNQDMWQHVWHFDGTRWEPRSGPGADDVNSLLDIQHNAVVTDPLYPQHLYVGADIGIWRSIDGGQSWEPFSQNLPDAAVIDLKLHPKRLLRASTHGRGVYECRI